MLLSCTGINHEAVSSVSQATVCTLQTFLSLLCVPSKSAHSFVWVHLSVCNYWLWWFFQWCAHMPIPHPYACKRCTHSHICTKNFPWSFRHKIRFSFGPAISALFNKRRLINYGRCHIIIILPRVLYSESILILMMGFSSLCALRHRGREAFPDYLGIW